MNIKELFKSLLPYIIKIIVVIFIGYIVLRLIKLFIKKILYKTKLDKIIISFILQIINPIIYFIYIFLVLDSIGIPLTGIALLASSLGLALSLALKDTISDIANGITLIISKPFKIGDYIEINNFEGSVELIGIINTILITVDNKKIFIPNSIVSQDVIINHTALNIRRLDMEFNISFEEDINIVKDIIKNVLDKEERILKDIKYSILIDKIESYLVYKIRAYCNTDIYWDLKYKLNEEIFNILKLNNIKIAYCKYDINING